MTTSTLTINTSPHDAAFLAQACADWASVARTHADLASVRVNTERRAHPDSLDALLDGAYYASLCAHTYAKHTNEESDKINRLIVCAAANDELAANIDTLAPERATEYRQAAERQREQTEIHADLAHHHYIRACRAVVTAGQLLAQFQNAQGRP